MQLKKNHQRSYKEDKDERKTTGQSDLHMQMVRSVHVRYSWSGRREAVCLLVFACWPAPLQPQADLYFWAEAVYSTLSPRNDVYLLW